MDFCRKLDVIALEGVASGQAGERAALAMRVLITDDAWLPDLWAAPSAERYQQHLLYLDPQSRFSVVSFVWGPGQHTPIHDHGGLWGVIGVLRGAERSTRYARSGDGRLIAQEPELLAAGAVDMLDPAVGDIHAVSNALPDAVSVSIHAYGGDIGSVERRAFDVDGTAKAFVSRYSPQVALLGALMS
mgnify:CR=1 FL=1